MAQGPAEDDDRTIISTSFGDSDLTQFVSSSSLFNHTLPDGTRLGEFEIRGLIGEGGFGIVYLAYDESLQRLVALKEYMPSSLAARSSTTATVSVKSERHRETFHAGLKSFVNEARLLAQFDHPSLVKVYRFWENHGTAYMVMPYYEGPTLKRALAELGRPPTETELTTWLHPLLNALEVMHNAHCFHRDIAPDNILLTATGPLLLDFGAARRVIGDMTHALTVVLKPGYAPIEQYGEESSSMTQGAWTDLYAMACVVYYAITGKAPMSSVDRMMADKLRPLREVGAGRYSPTLLKTMDACLAVKPDDRPQSVAQLRALLGAAAAPTERRAPQSPPAPAGTTTKASSRSSWWVLAAGLLLVTLAGWAWLAKTRTTSTSPVPATFAPRPQGIEPAKAMAGPPGPAPRPSISPPSSPESSTQSEIKRPAPPMKTLKEPAAIPQKNQAAPLRDPAVHARCGDILQKASLETLSPDETAFLKKECR